ncbi:MAG: hypothetical protein IJE08_00195 [Clostridia bacterium]|nr:hypothetical protein [Clostridia bacterium]
MKKVLCYMMTILLVLAAMAPMSALAAPGDAVLLQRDEFSSSYANSAVTIGDTAYMVIRDDEGEAFASAKVGDAKYERFILEEDSENKIYAYTMRLFGYEGRLMALNTRTGKVYSVALENGQTALTEEFALDWSVMRIGQGEDGYFREVGDTVVSGDVLYMTSYDESWSSMDLIAFSLKDGSSRVLGNRESFGDLAAYKDGRLVASIRVSENWLDPYVLFEISTEDGSVKQMMELADYSALGLNYDAANDRFIYEAEKTIWATDMNGNHTALATAPVSAPSGDSSEGGTGLLDGGYYFISGYEGTVIKNIDPAAQPTRTLTLRNIYLEMDDAYIAFAKEHPEAELKQMDRIGELTMDEVTQAMMSGSSEIDIYYLGVNSAAFRALVGRGYAADLSGSETIKSMTDRMFPVFQEVLTRDGKIVAFPDHVNASSYKINTALAAELGISEEEYPDTWDKLLDLIDRWDESYSKEFPEKALFDPYETANMKETIFNMLLKAQVVSINKPGAQASVNTPFMRRMMERLDSMSFAAFASDQDFSMGYSWSSNDVLLNSWGTILPRDMYREEEMETILFAESEEEGALVGIDMYVYVVNPYSKNIDLAIDYLEARAESMSEGMQATLLTDWRKPLRDPHFDRMLESYDKMIENRKKALSEAADDQKQAIEDEIKQMEAERERVIAREYVWTEEQLAEYRELTGHFVVIRNEYFTANSREGEAEEMQQLISRYVDGQMSADQMLSSLDKKLRMMQMEEGE